MRITDKGNICINGVPSTRFKAFSFDEAEAQDAPPPNNPFAALAGLKK
jgi:hypothetical protein